MSQQLPRCSWEEVGLTASVVEKVVRSLSQFASLHSVMMLRHGKVFFECWWKPYRSEDTHGLFSLSKSFTSMAIGLAQSEGLLRLNDRLIEFFPQYEPWVTDSRMKTVTLRDLLTMSSGHGSCASPYLVSDMDGDWIKGFLSSPLAYEPGSHFAYNSAATYMLAAVVKKVTDLNVREYLLPRLFEPLDIEPGPWECSPQGINKGGWGFNLRTEDLAKVGQLLLQGGVWHGRALLPKAYLDAATQKQIDNSMNGSPDWQAGYGYQFWKSVHGFRGDGASGQFMIVLPEEDMVIVTTAGLDNMQAVLDIFWQELLPGLTDRRLPFDAQGHERVDALVETLSIPPAQGDLTLSRPPQSWTFKDNQASIRQLRVWFKGDHCLLDFVTTSGCENVTAGFGFYCENYLKLNDSAVRKTMVSVAWVSPDVLELQVLCTESAFRETWRIDYGEPKTPLTSTSRYCTFRSAFLPMLEVKDETDG